MAEQEEPSVERRFFAFLVLSVGVLMLFNLWQARNVPPRKVEPDQAAQVADADQAKLADEEQPAAAVDDQQAVEQPAVAAEAPAELRYLTAGSVDHTSPYRMLVTFTTRSGGVQRVELSNPQFRDLHDRSGYLGHLELVTNPAGGARAQIVGAGTPAHKSGLRAGDVITEIALPDANGPVPIANAEEFDTALARTKPRDEVRLTVRRDGEAKQLEATRLTRRPLEVIRPEIENIRLYEEQPPADYVEHPSFVVQLKSVDELNAKGAELKAANKALATENWHVDAADESSVSFRKRLPELGLEVFKHYRLEQVPADQLADEDFPAYHFRMECEVRNLNAQPRKVAYELSGPNGLPIEGWWYATKVSRSWSAAGLRDVLSRFPGEGTLEASAAAIAGDDAEVFQANDAAGQPLGNVYAGVDAQYFASMILPSRDQNPTLFTEIRPEVVVPKPSDRWPPTYTNVSFRMVRVPLNLAAAGQPGDGTTDAFRVFNGPKRPDLLAQYKADDNPNYTLADILTYGWFGPVAQLMLYILHGFYAVVRNYGLAIILLTVLVRGLLFPISRKQAANMVKMQELKPEMDRIAEKFKTDMEKRTKAQQELFRKHSYNPMGGCLLMFLQLPVLIGLYRALMVDVELRDAPLISHAIRWCSNLAAPDMLYDWSWFMPDMVNNGIGFVGLGPYLNILPLVTVGLFLVQQKMFMPPPTNEQAAMQMKIMQYMMVVMGFFFFKVASGLCIYFIASSLWGMAERKLLPKPTPPDALPATSSKGPASSAKPAPRPPDHRNGAAKTAKEAKRSRSKRRK